jgi:hypothetical protein
MAETKENNEMEIERRVLSGILGQRYKRPLWDRFKDAVGIFFLAIIILLCLAIITFLVTNLIENPISLAILCGTIFLIWAWRDR